MFYDLVSRNSKRNQKENALFFSSLLVVIVAFYLILSLSNLDVMRFLATMESDAVDRLLSLIPLFYAATLFVVFFLVYFACKYQIENRKHEFGIYFMLGMKRHKLFFLLFAEDIRSSAAALAVGLPIGIVIFELISLITARIAGLGVIGHTFTVSGNAMIWTILGFVITKLIAFLILSGKVVRQEIEALLAPPPVGSKKQLPSVCYLLSLLIGVGLLVLAYGLAIRGLPWRYPKIMVMTLASGLAGTLLFFFGLRSFLEIMAARPGSRHRLQVFTFRQLQEEVIYKSNSMAISSLLILAALCCFGCGVAISMHYNGSEQHNIDYTFIEEESMDVIAELNDKGLSGLFDSIFEMKVGMIKTEEETYENVYAMDRFINAIDALPDSDDKNILLNNLGYQETPYLISLSGYNALLSGAGLTQIDLGEKEAVVYMDSNYTTASRTAILNNIIDTKPDVQINKETYHLTGSIQSINLVVDRSITLMFALIVSDQEFEQLTKGDYSRYQNAVLSKAQKEGKSLLTAVADTNKLLDETGVRYESYLQNIGRKMFYVVAASYLTIYLAIIFLIIANTVVGIQFLTQQQRTKGRYRTLIRIGASYRSLCYAAKKQINWYFGVIILVAAISSLFGIRALFSGILSSYTGADLKSMIAISCAMIILLCVIEYMYILAVKKSSDRFLLSLMTLEREE